MRGTFDPDTIEQSVDLLVAEAEGRSKAGRRGIAGRLPRRTVDPQ
jgi:hypothetical protein